MENVGEQSCNDQMINRNTRQTEHSKEGCVNLKYMISHEISVPWYAGQAKKRRRATQNYPILSRATTPYSIIFSYW